MTLGEADFEHLLQLRTGLRRFLRWSEEQSKAAGLTPAKHQLLLAIRGHPEPAGPTIGEIADYLVLRHHSAVGLIDRTVRDGLVRRNSDENSRSVVRVTLTPDGIAKLDALAETHLQELAHLAPTMRALWRTIERADGTPPHPAARPMPAPSRPSSRSARLCGQQFARENREVRPIRTGGARDAARPLAPPSASDASAGTISLVTSPASPVSSSTIANESAIRSSVSTMIVTTGTWQRSCSRRSPCRGWSPWKPQMPRRHVAPLAPLSRSRPRAPPERATAVARLLGGTHHQLLPHGSPCSSVAESGLGGDSKCPSRLHTRTRAHAHTLTREQCAAARPTPALGARSAHRSRSR